MERVVIVSAKRTPIGSFCGALSTVSAVKLGEAVVQDVMKQSNVSPKDVDEVILGQVFTAGCGQNPARQTSMNSGIPEETPAYGLNMLCGSGLKAVAIGAQAIAVGDANIVIAGGQESMSLAPHCMHLRNATKMGDGQMKDTMLKDGLTDAFTDIHMGITAENIAKEFEITRHDQDAFAVKSQNLAENAQTTGKFKNEITSVTIKSRRGDTVIAEDEYIRKGANLDSMAALKPCFIRDATGTVTPGNSSGLNDGAAAVLLMSESHALKSGAKPIARIISWAQAGVDPKIMGTGPIPATRKALEKANWKLEDVDLFEFNEAFSAQSLAVVRSLGANPDKVNIHGGAIALGHPLGASGARVLVTLIHALEDRNAKKGVAALCIGGGMGIAMCVERL